MRLLRPLLILGAACTLVVSLSGQTVRVLSVSGEATIQAPGDSGPRVVKKGDTIVIGTKIVTGEGARVILTPLPGVNSIIAPKSEVVIERVSITPAESAAKPPRHSAVLDLKTGAVTTDLKSTAGVELDYGVRTARGLAGARGTTYTVGINAAGIQTIVVADGHISLTLADGSVIDLVPGQVSITKTDGSTQTVTSASQLSAGDQALADNWVEATLEALAEAIEQGVDIDPEALEDAVRAAVGLGIDIDAETQAKLDRARDLLEDRRQARLDAATGATDTDAQDAQSIINEIRNSQEDTHHNDDYLHALAAYLLTLTTDQRSAFDVLPEDVQRLLVTVNDSAYTSYALDTYGEGQTRPVALIRYAGKLSSEWRAVYYERPGSVQEILAAHPADTGLRNFALTADGENGYPATYVVEYFQPLGSGQRSAFRALESSLREALAELNNPALTAYALATGRTPAQVSYAVSLPDQHLAIFVSFPANLQALLIDNAGDSQLADFAYTSDGQGGHLHSHAQILFYAGLSSEDRALYAQRPLDLRESAANDSAFAAILLARDSETQAPLYSDATLGHYLKLSGPDTPADYLSRPADVRDLFAQLDKPALTTAALDDSIFQTPPTDADLRRNLVALLALSPENRELFELFAGGPDYHNLDLAPSPADWSDDAWTRTRNSFNALSPADRSALLALGAMDGLFDYSATYLEAALADYVATLPKSVRDKIAAAGWGRHFVDYFANQDFRDFLADFGDFTATQVATLREFGISPEAFLSSSFNEMPALAASNEIEGPGGFDIRARLDDLAGLPAEDRALLAKLDVGDHILFASGELRGNAEGPSPTYADTLRDVLAFARALLDRAPDSLSALRDTGLAHHLFSYLPDDIIYVGDAPTTAIDRISDLLGFYVDLDAGQRDLARDVGLFENIYIGDAGIHPDSIAAALNALASVSDNTRDYLSHIRGDVPLLEILNGHYTYSYHDIDTLDALLSSLSPEEFATLRELRPGISLIQNFYADGGPIDLSALKGILAYVASLDDLQRFTMNELGITKDGNERKGLFFSDLEGLGRLLQAYSQLPKDLRVATRQLSTYEYDRDYHGRSFFFPSDDGYEYLTIYNVTFSSPDDLHVGAVRRLSITNYSYYLTDNEGPRPDTFTVPAGKDVYLRASTLVDLDGVSFSSHVRAITIEAATINLANLDFPEGSVVALNSKLGGLGENGRYPNFGYSEPGRVNFIQNVSYGGAEMHNEQSFDSASRGNIAIGSFANPATPPTYTPPPSITQ